MSVRLKVMGKITYDRGTTYTLTHIYQKNGVNSSDGVTLFFTVKSVDNDTDATDSTAILQKNVSMSGATNTITILPTDIPVTQEEGKYFYDLKVKESETVTYKVDEGTFVLNASPTNRNS